MKELKIKRALTMNCNLFDRSRIRLVASTPCVDMLWVQIYGVPEADFFCRTVLVL